MPIIVHRGQRAVYRGVMLLQLTAPRPIFNALENPPHVRIHTLRKPLVSKGEVLFVVGDEQMAVEPFMSYPIQGESAFEALDYYLPFWNVFGTKKPEYDEQAIQRNIESNRFSRIRTDAQKDKLLPGKDGEGAMEKLTGVQLALLGASGYKVIARSAFRSEGPTYEERIVNFTIICPVNGGGILRVADCPIDVANPTFDPHAPPPGEKRQDLTLLEAFNRTHRLRTSDIEERKRQRIAQAEANMRENEKALAAKAAEKGLPPKRDE
jgi:hypothetical protein